MWDLPHGRKKSPWRKVPEPLVCASLGVLTHPFDAPLGSCRRWEGGVAASSARLKRGLDRRGKVNRDFFTALAALRGRADSATESHRAAAAVQSQGNASPRAMNADSAAL